MVLRMANSVSSSRQNTIDHRSGVSEIVGRLHEPFNGRPIKNLNNFRIVRQKIN